MIVAIKEFFTAEMINDVISAAIGLIAFILLYLLIKKITKKINTLFVNLVFLIAIATTEKISAQA